MTKIFFKLIIWLTEYLPQTILPIEWQFIWFETNTVVSWKGWPLSCQVIYLNFRPLQITPICSISAQIFANPDL